jgi:O-antigen ligase
VGNESRAAAGAPLARFQLLAGGALVASAGWSIWVSLAVGGDPRPFVGLVAICFAVALLSWALSAVRHWLTPALIVVASLIVASLSGTMVLSPEPLAGPLGYANANAALFVQAAAAALMLAVTAPGPVPRVLGATAFPAFGIVALASGSVAASAVLLLPLAGLAGGLCRRVARLLTAAFAVLFLLSLAISIALAARFSRQGAEDSIDRSVQSLLDRRRVALWNDALVLMAEDPLTGVGPGRFAESRMTAPRDPDARWAHEEFLQQGAETGVPGFLFVTLVFLAGFGMLWDRADTRTAVAAGSLAAIGIHASLDYVLHFPAVPVAAAALLGAATGPREVSS